MVNTLGGLRERWPGWPVCSKADPRQLCPTELAAMKEMFVYTIQCIATSHSDQSTGHVTDALEELNCDFISFTPK